MTDRSELLECALDSLPRGVVLFGAEDEVVFWNRAAQAITGYAGMDLLSRPVPEGLEGLLPEWARRRDLEAGGEAQTGRSAIVHTCHKLGQEVQTFAQVVILRDALGQRIGAATVFHPAESVDALPHGETAEGEAAGASQADMEERLRIEFEDFAEGGLPFGVMWISVDQAHGLRKTHGSGACEAMLEKVQRALVQGLRPAEEVGRWGDDEFLIVSHERTAEMLAAHAQVLAGLSRTADFRWWGDRVSVTVSIGAAQACDGHGEELAQLLERAKRAMEASIHGGGNRITTAAGRQECLPS